MTQKIRPSQFITTYGPSSILETQKGPVVIPSADIGLFYDGSAFTTTDFKIQDDRMSKGILKGASIYRLPSNAERGLNGDVAIYKTKHFPNWGLCLNRHRHPQGTDILYLSTLCPVCSDSHGGRTDAIRFVTVCKKGHLDDIDWNYLVHEGNHCSHANIGSIDTSLKNDYVFLWRRTGGALKDINIECPRCGLQKNFGQSYYNKNWKCSGRNPERETPQQKASRPMTCDSPAKIMQRQAANIRMPEIKTLLSIQSIMTKLHRLVQNEKIRTTIKNATTFLGTLDSEEKIQKLLEAMRNADVAKNSIREFESSPLEEVRQVISELDKPVPDSYHELILDEFRELIRSSIQGAPPDPFKGKSKPIFEVIKHDIEKISTKKGTKFVVTPISTLQTISVQTGYKRDDTGDDLTQSDAELVDNAFFDEYGTKWYPGTSYVGEGIFLRLDDSVSLNDILDGESVREWLSTHHKETTAEEGQEDYTPFVFRDAEQSRDELHPGFVWWHTLSHLLIRMISEESGYSSSAIRERIYFEINGNKITGGILLYAAQPGSEGTLGGLTALVSHFESFLNAALEKSFSCSADPLCELQDFEHKKVIGSCCYGCLMNSETSCEHRNMWLDRKVLRDSVP